MSWWVGGWAVLLMVLWDVLLEALQMRVLDYCRLCSRRFGDGKFCPSHG